MMQNNLFLSTFIAAKMFNHLQNTEQLLRKTTLLTLCLMFVLGAIMTFFPVKPFWVDEWFIIDTLKNKNPHALWGQLNFLQQFPRTYLVLLQHFTSYFGYSYWSLRLPSFIVSICTGVLCYKLAKKIFSARTASRYLLVLVLVSSFTFTEYFVEMKQYPMDILLSVLAVWQVTEILDSGSIASFSIKKYLLLCISFLVAPFFSYTYPIAIAPLYVVALLQTISTGQFRLRIISRQWIPLIFGVGGIIAFYCADAKQLAADHTMYSRWGFLLINPHHKLRSAARGIYTLFSQTGAGLFFETVYGILGIAAFITTFISWLKHYLSRNINRDTYLQAYATLLLLLAILLFLAGKLPLGTPRLNVFTVPSIILLIIYFVDVSLRNPGARLILPLLLYAGAVGNIFVWYINYFASPVYSRQIAIYRSTQNALQLAASEKIPILITPGVTYPYEQATIDAGAPDPAVWVLKTFPAYHPDGGPPVYAINDTADACAFLNKLPPNITTAMAGDGINYRVVERK